MNIVQLSGLVSVIDKETEGKTFVVLSTDDEQVEVEISHLSTDVEVGDYVIASGKLKTVVDHLISSRSSVEIKSLSVDIHSVEVIHLKNSDKKVSRSHSVVSEKSSEADDGSDKKDEPEPEKKSVSRDEDDFEDDGQSKIHQHMQSVNNKSDDDKAYFDGHGSGDANIGTDFVVGKKDDSSLELPPEHNKVDKMADF